MSLLRLDELRCSEVYEYVALTCLDTTLTFIPHIITCGHGSLCWFLLYISCCVGIISLDVHIHDNMFSFADSLLVGIFFVLCSLVLQVSLELLIIVRYSYVIM